MLNCLILGNAGYLGSVLTGRLLEAGFKVHGLDCLMYDPNSLLRYADDPNFDFDKLDIRQINELKPFLAKADIIIPLQALVGYPLCEKRSVEAMQINFESNKWIAENKSKEQILIYPNTNSGYSYQTSNVPCTEETPMIPSTIYGKSKVEAEKVYQQTPGCTIVRLATIFGTSTRMRTDLLVNNFVWKALRDRVIVLFECNYMRNYVHIWDVCEAFSHIINNWNMCHDQTYNVGNDALNCNKLQLAEEIKKYVNFEIIKAEINSDPDVRNYIVSSQKFYKTGFECTYDLADGIKQLLKVYKMINQPFYGNY
jgi:nucleoside-diphosphate-sugar epimerase